MKNGARVIKFKEVEDPKNGGVKIDREHYVIEEDGNIVNHEAPVQRNEMY